MEGIVCVFDTKSKLIVDLQYALGVLSSLVLHVAKYRQEGVRSIPNR